MYREETGEKTNELQRIHRLIWQELQVFCHTALKAHENICKLVYIGWEETNQIPVLALEMAAYGKPRFQRLQKERHALTYSSQVP